MQQATCFSFNHAISPSVKAKLLQCFQNCILIAVIIYSYRTIAMLKVLFARMSQLLLLTLVAATTQSQGITTPRTPSPGAVVTQKIGIFTVTVNYSRPSVKNREVWGNLVPYGWNAQGFGTGNSAPWRAGANENTVIHFSHDAKVAGKPVPAGSYGLFFVINADNTGQVILSKDYRSWGSFFYTDKQDELRVDILLKGNFFYRNTDL